MHRLLQDNFRIVSVLAVILSFFLATGLHAFVQEDSQSRPVESSEAREADLIKILASTTSELGEKALACKQLAVYGSQEAAEELGKLLSDPQLASWARIALEAIPGDRSAAVLREALDQVDGELQIGVINSLGARRDEPSIAAIAGLMRQGDPDVTFAAAFALGKIGTIEASRELLSFLPEAPSSLQPAVAEGCIYCADRLLKSGSQEGVVEIYDRIRASDLPQQRVVEATRGAILARGDEGIPILVELFQSGDPRMLALGLQTARELDSEHVGTALISEIKQASPDRAALLVEALGDLPGQVDLDSLLSLAGEGSQEVRMAAISVLGRVGDASILSAMLQLARESNELQTAVRAALVDLPDDDVDQQILNRLSGAEDDKKILLELVGLRQLEATQQLVEALDDPNLDTRVAAIDALGQTVPQERMQVLIDLVLSPKNTSDQSAAIRALRAAAVRMPDREACSRLLASALQNASPDAKKHLLETIAAVGGTESLRVVGQYGLSSDESLRDLSTRLLGEWMTIDVAPVLLNLATSGPADRYQVRALRGYIRVARQFVMPEEQRMAMCRHAMEAAKNPAEQRLVLDVLKRYPNSSGLEIAIEALSVPSLQEDAKQAISTIAQKLADDAEVQKRVSELGIF